MRKRILSIILVCCMLSGILPLSVFATDIVASGYCGGEGDGTNLMWELDSGGTLTISGAGSMADYRVYSSSPWYDYLNHIFNVVIDEGVTTVGETAFMYHNNIVNIEFPNSLEKIGIYSLAYCTNITNLNLPNGLKAIHQHAFDNCSNLQNVTIPKTVTSIASGVFEDCPKLISAGPFGGGYNIEFDWETKIPSYTFSGCSYLEYIVIPSTIETIGTECFTDCTKLLTAGPIGGNYNIEFGWTSKFPSYAFLGCPKLTSIDIPESITSIGDRAFFECYSLIEINVDSNNSTYISVDGVLYSKDKTELIQYPSGKTGSYEIPQGVTTINNFAFGCTTQSGKCNNLTSIIIPESVTKIDHCAFQGCVSIETIDIPANITLISYMAFNHCSNLSSAYFYGDAPSTFNMTIGGIFDECSEDFTIYYIKGKSGWTDSEAYNADAGTWNGYKLECYSEPNDAGIFSYFGKLDGYSYNNSITIDNIDYSFSEKFKDSSSNIAFFWSGDYLDNYRYVAYNLNDSNEIEDCRILSGEICTLEGWDALNSIVDTDKIVIPILDPQKSYDPKLEGGNYYVSDIVKDTFPLEKIVGWIGDKVRVYTVGEQIYKVIHITEGEGVVTAFNEGAKIVYINDTAYEIADNDEGLISTIKYPFENQAKYTKEADFILYDGILVELKYFNTKFDPVNFNEYIYRSDIALDPNNDEYSRWQSYLHGKMINTGTPSKSTADACEDTGFASLARGWTATTKIFDSLVESPTVGIKYIMITQEDMYTAIILDSLECSYDINMISDVESGSKEIRDFTEIVFNFIKSMEDYENIVTRTNMKDIYGAFSKSEKESLANFIAKEFDKVYGDISATSEYLSDFSKYLNVGFDAADTFETWLVNCISYRKVLKLNDEMQSIIQKMYRSCPSDNKSMKKALKNCSDVINVGTENFNTLMMGKGVRIAGEFVAMQAGDMLWELISEVVEGIFPEVKIIKIIYKSGKFLANELFNADAQAEAYYKLLAMLNFENLGRSVMDTCASDFKGIHTVDLAKLYLESVKLNFQILNTDADYAIDFYQEMKKQPSNVISEWIAGTTIEEIIESWSLYKTTINLAQNRFDTWWIMRLESDYPELLVQYKDRLVKEIKLEKTLKIACPVNVYIYDQNDNVVAYINNGYPFAQGNISIVVEGDVKYVYFYDDEDYKIVCEGYDVGVMDIIINEYSDESVTGVINYLNIPVNNTSNHNLSMVSDQYIFDNTAELIVPTYDSQNEKPKHTITITNGFSTTNDTFEYELNASEGEIINISTYIPEGYSFEGWTSDNSLVVFDDPLCVSTSFVMVNKDVTINATVNTDLCIINAVATTGGYVTGSGAYSENDTVTVAATANEGYHFAHWLENNVEVSKNENYSFKVTTDRNLVAVFEASSPEEQKKDSDGYIFPIIIPPVVQSLYTLKFDTNGGNKIDKVTDTSGTIIDLSKYISEKEGYLFEGWYSDKNFITKVTSIKLTTNMTVYANWIKNTSDQKTEWKNPFKDIFETDDYYYAIQFVYEQGLFKGISENEFSPNTTMTRAMFVTVLGRLASINEHDYSGKSFNDVDVGECYSPYIEWAAQNNIIFGYGNGVFGVNDEITIEQAITVLGRYAQFKKIDITANNPLEQYTDFTDVSSWAIDEMAWAIEQNIYLGKSGMLTPQNKALRALVVVMIYNFSDLFEN